MKVPVEPSKNQSPGNVLVRLVYLNAVVALLGVWGYVSIAVDVGVLAPLGLLVAFFFVTPVCWGIGVVQLLTGIVMRFALRRDNPIHLHNIYSGLLAMLSLAVFLIAVSLGYVVAV